MPEIEDPPAGSAPPAPGMPASKGLLLAVMTVFWCGLVIADVGDGDAHAWGLVTYLAAMLLYVASSPPTLPVLGRYTRAMRSASGVAAVVSAAIELTFPTRGLDVVTGAAMALFGVLLLVPALFPRWITRFPWWFGPGR